MFTLMLGFNTSSTVVPHKAVAEVSKIGNLKEVVSHGWQGDPTDGSKSGWRQRSLVVVVVVAVVAV